jgi:flagellar biosynthesis anti-sigma factor FlgM
MHTATDMEEDEESMRVYGDKASLSIDLSPHQMGAVSTREAQASRPQGRTDHADQLHFSPKAREIRRAGQIVAQTSEVRETKIIELKRDVENGHYRVRAEQVAEKIVRDYLPDLFY